MNCSDSGKRGRCANRGFWCNDVSNLGCSCDKDWSSFGSLSLVEGSECAVHIPSTTIFFYIDAVVSFFCFVAIVRFFILRTINDRSQWIFKCDCKSLFPLCFCISVISGTLVDIFHIIYAGQELIGSNIWITLAVGFAVFLGFLGLTLYFFVVLTSIRGQSDYTSPEEALKLKAKYDFLSKLAPFVPPISFVAAFVPLLGIRYPKYRNEFIRAFILGIGLVAFSYGIIVTLALSYLLKSLSDHINKFDQTSIQIIVVHRRLRRACLVIASFAYPVGPIAILWIAWDWILIRSTYIIAGLLLSIPVACLTLILTVSAITSDEGSKHSKSSEHINLRFKQISKNIELRSANFFKFNQKIKPSTLGTGDLKSARKQLEMCSSDKFILPKNQSSDSEKHLTPCNQIIIKRHSFEQESKSDKHITHSSQTIEDPLRYV